jgi:hypothetical protein
MITFFDKDFLRSCVDSFNKDTDNQICILERESGKLFPYVRAGKLNYNPHFETFLLLQNMAVIPHANIGGLPSLFHDVYTLIDYNYYSVASDMLEDFENQITVLLRKDLNDLTGKMDINLCSQTITLLYHEFGHLYLPQNIDVFKNLTEYAKNYFTEVIDHNKRKKYHPIAFVSRGCTRMAKEMMNDDRMLEELACDLWGIWISFSHLKNNYDDNDYIQRIICQISFVIGLKIIFDFSEANTGRWIKDWKKNVLYYSGNLNRYNVATSYCVELGDDFDDKQNLLLWGRSLKNTILYNWKNAYSISRTLINNGSSPRLDLSQKKTLMERLSAIEKKIIDRLSND